MKHIKLYSSEDAFVAEKKNIKTPWIALSKEDKKSHYHLEPFDCLTLIAAEDSVTISMEITGEAPDKNFQYRINANNWADWDMSTLTLNEGDRMHIKSDSETGLSTANSNYHRFIISGKVHATGNIMSLVNYADTLPNHCFNALFNGCETLLSAPKLPCMNLSDHCYYDMFAHCTSLQIAPELPATTLVDYCYASMFSASGLRQMPKVHATELAPACYMGFVAGCENIVDASDFVFPNVEVPASAYYNMFYHCYNLKKLPNSLNGISMGTNACRGMFVDCTSLEVAPELPATSVGDGCYQSMFSGCSSLTTAPELPATILGTQCYHLMFNKCSSLSVITSKLPATTLMKNCYNQMFADCPSITKSPEFHPDILAETCCKYMFLRCSSLVEVPSILPSTTLETSCYYGMFHGCSSLTTAPELPATELVSGCYSEMFYQCKNLNYIKALFTTTPSTTYNKVWVSGVSSTGTFVKSKDATWTTTGTSAVPTGWTIETA